MFSKIKPSNLFFCSDMHFSHRNICKYSNRPWDSWEDMNEGLIKNWNETIGNEDYVFMLGDFTFQAHLPGSFGVLRRLNGHMFFINGNHDEKFLKFIHETNPTNLTYLGPYFEFYPKFSDNVPLINLCHYCIVNYNLSSKGAWMLFGHSHSTLNNWVSDHIPASKTMDVGIDSLASFFANKERRPVKQSDYKPIGYLELKRYMDKIDYKKIDHH